MSKSDMLIVFSLCLFSVQQTLTCYVNVRTQAQAGRQADRDRQTDRQTHTHNSGTDTEADTDIPCISPLAPLMAEERAAGQT